MLDTSVLTSKLTGSLLTPNDTGYSDSVKRWAENAERRAKYLVLCETVQDISHSIRWATGNSLEIAIRGGGHSFSGASSTEGGLVIDLTKMRDVRVDSQARLITVQGGCLWADVDEAAAKHGLVAVTAGVNQTGVGGLTLGGGYGSFSGQYGLTIDNIVELEIVLANGDVVKANETTNQSLFWASKGGGSNFGVVSQFIFKAYPHENNVWGGNLIFPISRADEIVATFKEHWAGVTPKETTFVILAAPPPAFQPVIIVNVFYDGSMEEGRQRFASFLKLEPLKDLTNVHTIIEQNTPPPSVTAFGDRKYMKGMAYRQFSPELFKYIIDRYRELVSHPDFAQSALLFQHIPFDKINSIKSDATAYALRGQFFNLVFNMRWKSADNDMNVKDWVVTTMTMARKIDSEISGTPTGTAQSIETIGHSNMTFGDENVKDIFRENYERLRDVKKEYDPNKVFHKWFCIEPAK